MEIQSGDRLVKRGRSPLIVIALCEDQSRAWVVDRLEHGLVNGGAYIVDLDGYEALR